MTRHSAQPPDKPKRPSTARASYKAREAEEKEEDRQSWLEREKRFAAALRLASGPANGPANLIATAEMLEARGRRNDAALAAHMRGRADAILEARRIVEAASWNPPE